MSSGAGNRQDNRQRGNAAQLLEKYKGLARDMQMQGDRVQTEYYLQFADHYYRILNESRARFEEQRRERGETGYDASYDDDDQEEMEAAAEGRDRPPADRPEARDTRDEHRRDEPRRDEPRRDESPRHEGAREERGRGNGEFRNRRPRGHYGDEGERYAENDSGNAGNEERLAADILPPSIGAMNADESGEADEAPRRPRRPRRPRNDPGEEIAPAA